jgi:hypothetical protein
VDRFCYLELSYLASLHVDRQRVMTWINARFGRPQQLRAQPELRPDGLSSFDFVPGSPVRIRPPWLPGDGRTMGPKKRPMIRRPLSLDDTDE